MGIGKSQRTCRLSIGARILPGKPGRDLQLPRHRRAQVCLQVVPQALCGMRGICFWNAPPLLVSDANSLIAQCPCLSKYASSLDELGAKMLALPAV